MGWCTAQCKVMLFYVKTLVKESWNFELARLIKKKKKERKTFWPSGNFLVWYFHNAFSLHWVCCMSWSIWKLMVHCHKGLQVYCFWDFERLYYRMLRVRAIPIVNASRRPCMFLHNAIYSGIILWEKTVTAPSTLTALHHNGYLTQLQKDAKGLVGTHKKVTLSLAWWLYSQLGHALFGLSFQLTRKYHRIRIQLRL